MQKLGGELGFKLNPQARVDEMAVSDQQKLEIMKVLLAGARILILDEPTAVLTEAEAQAALGLARNWRTAGAPWCSSPISCAMCWASPTA